MNIGFTFTGLSDAARASAEIAKNFERVSTAQASIAASQTDQPVGPASRLMQARANLEARVAAGAAPEKIADAGIALANAQRGFDRAAKVLEGPVQQGLGEKLMGVLASSRFGVGGGAAQIMPLVGRTLEAIGGENAGPLGLAIAGLTALARATEESANQIRELSRASIVSGGNVGQASFLRGMGLDPAQGAALRQRMATDPFAMVAGSRLGIEAQQQLPFGSQNTAALQIRVIEGLRSITSAEEQLRLARMLGQESTLELARNLSDLTVKQLELDAAVQRQVVDKSAQQGATEFGVSLNRLGASFSTLIQAFDKPVMVVAAAEMNRLATTINALAVVADVTVRASGLGMLAQILQSIQNAQLPDWLKKLTGQGGATDEHTKAMQEHAAALREGTFGGGARARGAMPSDLRGDMLSRELEKGAIRLGAF